jgi:hypothetical protein
MHVSLCLDGTSVQHHGSCLQVIPKFVPGANVARVDLIPQWDTQHNSPAQSLSADVPFHELARRCVCFLVCRFVQFQKRNLAPGLCLCSRFSSTVLGTLLPRAEQIATCRQDSMGCNRRNKATTSRAIAEQFLPALGSMLGAMCKASCLSAADLEALAGSVLQMHAYFQAYSWDITWDSSMVSQSAKQ